MVSEVSMVLSRFKKLLSKSNLLLKVIFNIKFIFSLVFMYLSKKKEAIHLTIQTFKSIVVTEKVHSI